MQMIADPRYAGRLHNKHSGDTIMTLQTVREAINFNVELADESTWLINLVGSRCDVKEVQEIVQHLFTNIVKPACSK